jgi:Metalloenzyme superfamily
MAAVMSPVISIVGVLVVLAAMLAQRKQRRALLGGAALAAMLAGCGASARFYEHGCPVPRATTAAAPAPRAAAEREGRTRNVIVITIDGARWQEIFNGVDAARARDAKLPPCDVVAAETLLPNLHRYFIEGGVAVGAPGHAPMVASGPNFVSLPGYREIFTGRPSTCTSNFCGAIGERTLLDELRAQQQLAPEQIAVITSWERIARAAALEPDAIAISAGRTHGARRELLRVSPAASLLFDQASAAHAYPGWLDYRPDRYTAALALEYVVHERPRFLFVGLGDTDEYAHRGNYEGYLAALAAADRFVGQLMEALAAQGEYGAETAVLVTADHGRAANFSSHGGGAPESSRVWLLAAGGAISPRGLVDASRVTRLADIAPTVRRMLGLRGDRSPESGAALAELAAPTLDGAPVAGGGETAR